MGHFVFPIFHVILETMNWDSWIALIALLFALVGLALQWTRGHSRLKVTVQQSIPVYGGNLGDMMLGIEVSNQRTGSVQIRKLWVPMPSGKNAFFPDITAEKPMPCTLGPFESTSFLTPLRDLAREFVQGGSRGRTKITAIVEDGSGHRFRGSKRIDVSDWASSR